MAEQVSNISSCVSSVLNQMKKFGAGENDRAWLTNIAIRFYSDKLRGFNMPSIRTVAFPPTTKVRHWSWPNDYMTYSKIGYKCNGSSHVYTLGISNTMDISDAIGTCAVPIEHCNGSEMSGLYPFANGWQNGLGYSLTMYAQGGGFSTNYYRVDYENRCIRFKDELPLGIAYIEYVSNGGNVNEDTIILLAYRGSFEDYLKWQFVALNPALKNFEQGFKMQFKEQIWDSNLMVYGMNAQELRDEINRAIGFNQSGT